MPIARKRPFISVPAATAAAAVPPPASTASAANWADPAKTIAEVRIGLERREAGLPGQHAERHRQHEPHDGVRDAEPDPGHEGLPHGHTLGGSTDGNPAAPSKRWLKHEEHRLPVLRPLDPLAAVADAVGVRRAAPVDRARRGGRGAGRGRRVLPGAPLRAPARLAVPAAGRGRRADQPDRARHRRDRHALREPALHGRGRRRRRPDRRRPAPARHQPGVTGAGHRRLPLLRLRARRGHRPRRHGPRAHRGSSSRCSRARGSPSPTRGRCSPTRPGCCRIEPHSPGLRDRIWWGAGTRQDRGVDRRAGHEPDELDPAHRGHRRAVPPAPGRADPDVPRRLDGGRPRARAAGLGEPQHLPARQRPGPRVLRPRDRAARTRSATSTAAWPASASRTPASRTSWSRSSPRTRRSPPRTRCCSRSRTSWASTTTRTCSTACCGTSRRSSAGADECPSLAGGRPARRSAPWPRPRRGWPRPAW